MFAVLRKIKKDTWLFFLAQGIIATFGIVGHLYDPDAFSFLEIPEVLIISFLLLVMLNALYFLRLIGEIERKSRKNYISISSSLGADIGEAYVYGEIGFLGYDSHLEIIWTSELFVERGLELLGENVLAKFAGLKPFFGDLMEKPKEIKVENALRMYGVIHLPELRILIFKDISEIEHLYTLRKEEALVVTTITLDNYTDLVTMAKEERFSQTEAEIRKSILDWAKDNDIFLRRIKDDSYLGFLQEKTFSLLAKDQFKILGRVRDIAQSNDVSLTMSLGFGRGVSDVIRLADLSATAIDVALSRGGNQVVINNYGSHMEFYGGGSDKKIKKNAVRTRVLSLSFFAHLQNNQTILIVPHDQADMDAIGSALGVYTLAHSAGKNAFIVADENQIESKTRAALKSMFKKDKLDQILLSPERALAIRGNDTLVVMVDVHRPMIATSPKLLESAPRIAVIDHHRRAEDIIDNPVFSIIDTTASSASEIITELIRYNKVKIQLPPEVATFMLAGIFLDTNSFRTHTTASTFEAATLLKDYNADSAKADSFLKDEYEEYILKTKIMSNMETPYFGVMVASASQNDIIDRTLLAKVGDEAMSVKGIKAIFVIGMIGEKMVGISGRSDGTMNVQLLMEKMGGGGHFSGAAVQLEGSTIANARQQLLELMELYINDMRQD